MPSRRVLVTGVASYWGGKLAQRLESLPQIEAIIGVDIEDPTAELERTEFVKVGAQHSLLKRIVEAAEIDTVLDTRLIVDPLGVSRRHAHEVNVIGTVNIIAACSGAASPVRRLVLKSSAHYYGCAQDDPAFFREDYPRRRPPATPTERDVVEAEAAVAEFAEASPGVTVTVLRCANVVGGSVQTSHVKLLSLPAVPTIFGFDPRYQFVHEDDVVAALVHSSQRDIPGTYNVAGVLALTEVISLLGKHPAPILPAWGTRLAAGPLRAAGVPISREMLEQLRYGRGLDNRKLKSTGFRYEHTTREAVLKLRERQRLGRLLEADSPFHYEREVEEFLRRSPHVRR
jgi:UDP-glucose 4-epimerase